MIRRHAALLALLGAGAFSVAGCPTTTPGGNASPSPTPSPVTQVTPTPAPGGGQAAITSFTQVTASGTGRLGADLQGNVYLTQPGAGFVSGTLQRIASGSTSLEDYGGGELAFPETPVVSDEGGNLYVGTGGISSAIYRRTPGGNWTAYGTGLTNFVSPRFVHVDPVGDRLFYSYLGSSAQYRLATSSATVAGWSLINGTGETFSVAGVFDLATDSTGKVWAGVRRGVAFMPPNATDWTPITSPTGFSGDVLSVEVDGADNVYGVFQSASAGGIYKLGAGATSWTLTSGVTASAIEASRTNLARDAAGNLFFASGKTVYRLASGGSEWVAQTGLDVSGDVTAQTLVVDASNRLWINFSGAGGLYRSNP